MVVRATDAQHSRHRPWLRLPTNWPSISHQEKGPQLIQWPPSTNEYKHVHWQHLLLVTPFFLCTDISTLCTRPSALLVKVSDSVPEFSGCPPPLCCRWLSVSAVLISNRFPRGILHWCVYYGITVAKQHRQRNFLRAEKGSPLIGSWSGRPAWNTGQEAESLEASRVLWEAFHSMVCFFCRLHSGTICLWLCKRNRLPAGCICPWRRPRIWSHSTNLVTK